VRVSTNSCPLRSRVRSPEQQVLRQLLGDGGATHDLGGAFAAGLLGPLLGAMQCELQALARALGMAAATSGDNSVSNTAATDAVRELGALQLEWQALHAVRDAVARQLETQGYEEALAYSTVGARRLLERWQTAYERACEGASQAVSLAPLFAENSAQTGVAPRSLARDLRLVLGIARGVAQSRQRQTGQQLLHSISS